MASPAAFALVDDQRFKRHRAPAGHPECPERLEAVELALEPFSPRVQHRAPRPAEPDEVLRIHRAAHLAALGRLAGRSAQLDPDTYVSPESYAVALLAAGATVDLTLAVARGEARCGLAAVRPPGHHAESDRAMGFCLLNNVAIAARAAQAEQGIDRVLILDWDVHHGNGTQHQFEDDPSVLYVSTHQFPFYPGTGAAGEAGRGRGEGATLNVPMPAGCGDAEYVGAFHRLLVPAARAFRPELILVSCGFDAHAADPLASMEVGEAGFAGMTAIVRALADELCGGRVVFVLEGGYAPIGLVEGTRALLSGMLPDRAPALPPVPDCAAGTPLRSVVDRVVAVHARHFPGLGAP